MQQSCRTFWLPNSGLPLIVEKITCFCKECGSGGSGVATRDSDIDLSLLGTNCVAKVKP